MALLFFRSHNLTFDPFFKIGETVHCKYVDFGVSPQNLKAAPFTPVMTQDSVVTLLVSQPTHPPLNPILS
jgi:hypothetical protein